MLFAPRSVSVSAMSLEMKRLMSTKNAGIVGMLLKPAQASVFTDHRNQIASHRLGCSRVLTEVEK
jgi:hypothetical protein